MKDNQLTLPLAETSGFGEYLSNMPLKPKLDPLETLKEMGTVIISDKAMHQIQYLLRKFPSNEWSGILVYQVIKGDLLNLQDMICYVRYVYLCDIGSGAFTEFNTTGDMMHMFDEYPEAMDMRFGFIHSHHGMGTSFSGTDTEELQINAPQHLYYLSLIVSHRPEFSAKLAFQGQKMNTYIQSFRNINDELEGTTFSSQSNVIFVANMNVYQEMDQVMEKRIGAVREIVTKKQADSALIKKESDAMQKLMNKGKERAWTREKELGNMDSSIKFPKPKPKKNGTSSGKIKPKVPVKKATSWNPDTKEFIKYIDNDAAEDVLNIMLTGFNFGKLRPIFQTAEFVDYDDLVTYIEGLIDENYDNGDNWQFLEQTWFHDIPVMDLDLVIYEAFVQGADKMVEDYQLLYNPLALKDVAFIAKHHLLKRIQSDNSLGNE